MSAPPEHLAEARRLLDKGFKLVPLKDGLKEPEGEEWQLHPVKNIGSHASGYGILLGVNGLGSVDPDNLEPARAGLLRCGFILEDIMQAGVRTSSTRPGSGGRSTFKAPPGLKRINFTSKTRGVLLELRATGTNLQDCIPGRPYFTKSGAGPFTQEYANGRTFDEAPDLPTKLLAWWTRMSTDLEYLRQQQSRFSGPDAVQAVSSGRALAYTSDMRTDFNAAHDVPELLARHGYIEAANGGRWSPPKSSSAPGVRAIAGRDGLWQSDHGSDPLFGTFDAWTAHVVLDHEGSLGDAEAAWAPLHALALVDGFDDVAVMEGNIEPLPPFKRKVNGEIKPTMGNVTLALARPDLCGYRLRFDSFRCETMIADYGTDGWRSWQDTDYVRLQLNLESVGFATVGADMLRGAVHYVAEQNGFDSAKFWLTGLVWDGAPRVAGFLHAYFGTASTPYTRAVSEYLWSALAGRVLEPGVKCDMVPVAVGPQGARKSSAVAAMAPAPDFFLELDLSNKDDEQARLMRGKLLVELAELKGLRSRDAEHIKAFVSRQYETWTPKYMESQTRYARRSVFFGTSNRDDFLADDTGNRRWLPFNCGQCDPDGIARDREQLWAEAHELFKSHGVLHRAAEQQAHAELAAFAAQDDWDHAVSEWLRRPEFVTGRAPGGLDHLTSRAVLKDCFGLLDVQQTPALQSRVKSVLIRLGYSPDQRRIGGRVMRVFDAPSLF